MAIVTTELALYQIHNDRPIYAYSWEQGEWKNVDNNPNSKGIAASESELYQMHKDGSVWWWGESTVQGWLELDADPKMTGGTTAIVADGHDIYQLRTDGSIWNATGNPFTGWQQLDSNPQAKAIAAAGGNLYHLHTTGSIWQYTGTPLTGWQELDHNSQTIAIAASQLPAPVPLPSAPPHRLRRRHHRLLHPNRHGNFALCVPENLEAVSSPFPTLAANWTRPRRPISRLRKQARARGRFARRTQGPVHKRSPFEDFVAALSDLAMRGHWLTSGAHGRTGRDGGNPNHKSTLLSNLVMAPMRSPVRPRT